MNFQKVKSSVCESTREGLEQFGRGAARVGRGTLAGLIAGAVAAYAMNRYMEIESRPVRARRAEQSEQSHQPQQQKNPAQQQAGESGEPTVAIAQHVSRKLFNHELSETEKKAAGPLVHYGYAAIAGALYGGLAELIPTIGAGIGIPYATILWLGGDEIALPAMGITDPPNKVPAEKHASQLATHFVYGLTLDIGRRILRRVL